MIEQALFEKVENQLLMLSEVEYFKKRKRLKILTPKQMFQRLPIALAQVKVGNKQVETPKNVLN